MTKPQESKYKNTTLVDVQLASAYYPILVDLAKYKQCVTYGELVERAQTQYPSRPIVQNAIAVSTGRRLDVVRMFTNDRGLPDLTSLVVNKGTGECGVGFTRNFDPKVARATVFLFDWNSVKTDFDGFIRHSTTAVLPRKTVKESQALKLMANYYGDHKSELPSAVKDYREQIIEMIMEGFTPEEAFKSALKDVA